MIYNSAIIMSPGIAGLIIIIIFTTLEPLFLQFLAGRNLLLFNVV